MSERRTARTVIVPLSEWAASRPADPEFYRRQAELILLEALSRTPDEEVRRALIKMVNEKGRPLVGTSGPSKAVTVRKETSLLLCDLRRTVYKDIRSSNGAADKILEAAGRYMSGQWRRDVDAERSPAVEPQRSIHRILTVNDGKFPSHGKIRKIFDEERKLAKNS
ncbi:hypothetical protein [Mesorhizobium xinjiangense]|uniref:hypothetical protein n=1 Tax=Mesorhizobium xinjiangense TaxID=2678685 RepID=UPI0012EDEAC8|nr:hypothetical protein [Mesorhizobium xinjiangense]